MSADIAPLAPRDSVFALVPGTLNFMGILGAIDREGEAITGRSASHPAESRPVREIGTMWWT